MVKYRISNKAVNDLEEIWIYTYENWSIEQADRYYNLIIAEIEYLTTNPGSGISKEYIKKGYRASKVKSHLIFYKLNQEKNVEVIRILHQKMDVESRMKED